jgi:SAM-dependent methyltransferase
MLLYALTVFLSAFLLFQIQPMIAKVILPWFGGSAAVWTTCLVFFQVVLLLGYLYAHWIVRYVRPRARMLLHVGLLLISAISLPVMPKQSWKPLGTDQPTLRILALLLTTVGLPYFLLSTTGPLLQFWYTERPHRDPGTSSPKSAASKPLPYWLYSLSNAGSMLALISYPVLVEPLLRSRQQLLGWSSAYVIFAVLCATVALRSRYQEQPSPHGLTANRRLEETARPGWRLHALWTALAACSSCLLLAVTNHLTQNVAAVPLLWLLPLTVYLMSFIVCFGARSWQWNRSFLPLPALAIISMAYAFATGSEDTSAKVLIGLFTAGLFVCCLFCHGELSRLKPDPRYLTSFYLMISLGGALGGSFVALFAPYAFRGHYELAIGIVLCAILALFLLYRDPRQRGWEPAWLVLLGLTFGLSVYLGREVREWTRNARLVVRNFYGSLQVTDADDSDDSDTDGPVRTLTNGTIMHGEQFLDAERRTRPTTYYGLSSGVGLAIRTSQSHPHLRVGAIGLGAGTLASYGRPGDSYQFYEINPLVIKVAHSQFTYLKDSKATVQVVLGDARLSLEREPKQSFDVLAVDAFSSDSIPVHLLTKEAFDLYFHHLKDDGVLAIHVSNRYVDLEPVVARAAAALGKEAMVVDSDEDESQALAAASWVLVSGNHAFFQSPLIEAQAKPVEKRARLRMWTDDYSSLYPLLR